MDGLAGVSRRRRSSNKSSITFNWGLVLCPLDGKQKERGVSFIKLQNNSHNSFQLGGGRIDCQLPSVARRHVEFFSEPADCVYIISSPEIALQPFSTWD